MNSKGLKGYDSDQNGTANEPQMFITGPVHSEVEHMKNASSIHIWQVVLYFAPVYSCGSVVSDPEGYYTNAYSFLINYCQSNLRSYNVHITHSVSAQT